MSVLCNPADPKYIPDHIYMYIHILFYSVILYCIALHYIIFYNYITLYMYIMTSSLIMCVHILDRIKSIVLLHIMGFKNGKNPPQNDRIPLVTALVGNLDTSRDPGT